jgi:hypothetical protein
MGMGAAPDGGALAAGAAVEAGAGGAAGGGAEAGAAVDAGACAAAEGAAGVGIGKSGCVVGDRRGGGMAGAGLLKTRNCGSLGMTGAGVGGRPGWVVGLRWAVDERVG